MVKDICVALSNMDIFPPSIQIYGKSQLVIHLLYAYSLEYEYFTYEQDVPEEWKETHPDKEMIL